MCNGSVQFVYEMDLIKFLLVIYYILGLISDLYAHFSVNLHFFVQDILQVMKLREENAKDTSSYVEQRSFNRPRKTCFSKRNEVKTLI